ncbi:MAG: biopolymer transporter ExbD [Myxococcales bacterium]|nr:biopolymer transporter ExbD [Myxococcales bacterium]
MRRLTSMQQGKRVWRRDEPQEGQLNLTSMVDVLTILLIFLLMSYSADPKLFYAGADLIMPKSYARESIKRTVQVAVTEDRVLHDGQEILFDLPSYTTTEDHLNIDALAAMLEVKKLEIQRREAAERAKARAAGASAPEPDPSEAWKGEVIIQGDKNITFNTLKRIMYTADRAGFPIQSLALLAKTQ